MSDQGQLESEYLQRLGQPDPAGAGCEPDFLIISPAKTGTHWLDANLRCHPELFIPKIKEIHYFSRYWKRFPISWYLQHFQEAGLQQKKGEATPCAGLPLSMIRSIKRRFPHLKLIFLMRNPIQRAWSEAKHAYLHRERAFAAFDGSFAAVPEGKFLEQFTELYNVNGGDYLACLKRWLSCFDRDQICVGFFESIATAPRQLLNQLFRHLGVKCRSDWSGFPLAERILPGMKHEIPSHLRPYLQAIYGEKTRALVTFLREKFQLTPPPEWTTTQTADEVCPLLLEEGYQTFDLFLYRSKFYALPPGGDRGILGKREEEVRQCQRRGECFVGDSLDEVKYYVDHGVDCSDRETHLVRRFLQDVATRFSLPVHQVERYLGFRIVLCQDKFLALSQALDGVDLTKLDASAVREYQSDGLCLVADSLADVHQLLDPPHLVLADYQEFNIVEYRGKFYGCSRVLGPLDLTLLDERTLPEYLAQGLMVTADSLEEVKARIDQLAGRHRLARVVRKACERFIAPLRGFRLVRFIVALQWNQLRR